MRKLALRCRSVLIGSVIAVVYLAALALLALRVDRLSFQDLHQRSMQVESILRSLSPESFERPQAIPRIFPWQRALLIDEERAVLADSGWLENDTLSSGRSGSFLAKRGVEFADLRSPPTTDEEVLGRLIREAPASGYFGLLDARTIGAGRAIAWKGKVYGLVVLADKRDLIAAKHMDHLLLLAAFLLVLILPAVLMAFVYFRLVAPLNRLARAVLRLGPEEDAQDIELPGEERADEIGLVSSSFGAALREARKSRLRLKDFVDDVLHELKNPLSSLRGRLELTRMRGEAARASFALAAPELDRLLSELGRIERLLAGLASLSAADSQEVRGASSPSALLGELAAAYAELGKPIDLEDRSDKGAEVPLDPETFSRLVRILVDNALDFSPPGEVVSLRAESIGSFFSLRVADRGPGVPPERREWIFGRFASTRKGGSDQHGGLGLAIARSLVSGIGGGEGRASLVVEDNPGGGAVFVLSLPLTAPRRGGRG